MPSISCPGCETRFQIDPSVYGKKTRCTRCRLIFEVDPPASSSSSRRRRDDEDDEDDRISDSPRRPSRLSASSPRRGRDADEERPSRRAGRRDEDDEEEEEERPDKKAGNNVPWLVGGGVACFALLVGGVVAAVVLSGGKKKDDDKQAVITPPPIQQPNDQNPPVVNPPVVNPPVVKPPDDPPPRKDPTRKGELSREARQAVKRATAYLRVTNGDGSMATGTGFFGVPDTPTAVLTNAHVVGMLDSGSARPRRVEVIINSGEKDEASFEGTVAGVDRDSDLAVILVQGGTNLPRPLRVKDASGLQELDKLFVFGFPLGEKLGKEITIRDSSVSSFRKKRGVLDRIQVNGGMDPGNSGGPVVDDEGHVVGVAVSGIPGRMINFAIPGDRIHSIVNGRIVGMEQSTMFRSEQTGQGLGLPVRVSMIDPLGKIKDVAMEVWTGDPPTRDKPGREPSDAPPRAEPGDGPRARTVLAYGAGKGGGDLILPALPAGKVYWMQPSWSYIDGRKRWAAGNVVPYTPGAYVDRKPARLLARYDLTGQTGRRVEFLMANKMRVSAGEDAEVAALANSAVLSELAMPQMPGRRGASLRHRYLSVDRAYAVGGQAQRSKLLDLIRPELTKRVQGYLEVDENGGVTRSGVVNEQQYRASKTGLYSVSFHKFMSEGLEALFLSMPAQPGAQPGAQPQEVAPLKAWKLTRSITMQIDEDDVRKVPLDLTCTYLGINGAGTQREVAVIEVTGEVKDPRGVLGGPVSGRVLLNLKTGVVEESELVVTTDIPSVGITLDGRLQKIRVLSRTELRLKRS